MSKLVKKIEMNGVKIVLVFFLLSTKLSLAVGQEENEIEECIKKGDFTELPYVSTEKNPAKSMNISEKNRKGIPTYVYNDLRGVNQQIESYCEIFNYFESMNKNYKIILILLGEFENFRFLLATYNLSGKLLSWQEVCYKFDSFRNFKQWKLNKDMTLEVYNIKVLSPDRVDSNYKNDFKELKAQRIDTYYQIDSLGHFEKIKEILYEPEIYPRSYFEREEYPIWNGQEVVLKE